MGTKEHAALFLNSVDPCSGFLHFGRALTDELHHNTEADKAMKQLLSLITKINFDKSIMDSAKSVRQLNSIKLPSINDPALTALLVVLYTKAKSNLWRLSEDKLSNIAASALKGYTSLLESEPELPNELLRETIARAEADQSFAAELKAGTEELRQIIPALTSLGKNPWEVACIIAGFTWAIWVCIAIGIALVIIWVSSK